MCGIIGGFSRNKKSTNDMLIDVYEEQYSRGQKGFGILGFGLDMKYKLLRATEPVKFLVDLNLKKFPFIIGHHRSPTSTDNFLNQTHPIKVSHEELTYDYYVVHNGVIGNTNNLRKVHEAKGILYNTFYEEETWNKVITEKWNDSESLAIELAWFIEGRKDKIEISGSAAFIVAQIEKKTEKVKNVFFGRNQGSPLMVTGYEDALIIASENQEVMLDPFMIYHMPGIQKGIAKAEPFRKFEQIPVLELPASFKVVEGKIVPTEDSDASATAGVIKSLATASPSGTSVTQTNNSSPKGDSSQGKDMPDIVYADDHGPAGYDMDRGDAAIDGPKTPKWDKMSEDIYRITETWTDDFVEAMTGDIDALNYIDAKDFAADLVTKLNRAIAYHKDGVTAETQAIMGSEHKDLATHEADIHRNLDSIASQIEEGHED